MKSEKTEVYIKIDDNSSLRRLFDATFWKIKVNVSSAHHHSTLFIVEYQLETLRELALLCRVKKRDENIFRFMNDFFFHFDRWKEKIYVFFLAWRDFIEWNGFFSLTQNSPWMVKKIDENSIFSCFSSLSSVWQSNKREIFPSLICIRHPSDTRSSSRIYAEYFHSILFNQSFFFQLLWLPMEEYDCLLGSCEEIEKEII